MSIEDKFSSITNEDRRAEMKSWFKTLVQQDAYVGDLYSINYETARVIIHDYQRMRVGGIPSLCFLIATRIDPDSDEIDFKKEDTSLILLRVMDSAPLPQDSEAERIRVETAERVSGEISQHWDSEGAMDAKTRNLLGYAGVECRIIGIFNINLPPRLWIFPCGIERRVYAYRGIIYKPVPSLLRKEDLLLVE